MEILNRRSLMARVYARRMSEDSTTDPSVMTAAVTMGHGGPEQTEIRHDWPCPLPGPGEALVRVRAAALNNTDVWSRQGSYGSASDPDAVAGWKGVPLDFPRIQGIDVAGEVAAVGTGVDEGWLGTRVLVDPTVRYEGDFPADIAGSEADGGFAQFHSCAVDRLRDVSGSPLTDAQLACLPTAYGTAMGMINRSPAKPGDRVLVTGASGGVGMAGVQLLAAKGCHVVARTSPSKRELVRSAGAVELSVRGDDDIADLDPVAVVLDVVGGEEFGSLIDRLADGGTLVVAGAIAGPVFPFDVRRLYLHQRTIVGSTMHTPTDFDDLAAIATAGTIAPVVAATYSLDDLAEAQRHFASKDFVGKIVLTMS